MKKAVNLKKIIISMMAVMLLLVPLCIYAAESGKDIIETAQGDRDLSTLVTALQTAGLTETLKGEGPFTVFAPTNEAFKKLPAGTLDNLLKPENKNQLTDVLTYHVTRGRVPSAEAAKLAGKDVTMLSGKPARIEARGNDLYIDGAKIIKKDIQAKNGVIHVIDAVMLP